MTTKITIDEINEAIQIACSFIDGFLWRGNYGYPNEEPLDAACVAYVDRHYTFPDHENIKKDKVKKELKECYLQYKSMREKT